MSVEKDDVDNIPESNKDSDHKHNQKHHKQLAEIPDRKHREDIKPKSEGKHQHKHDHEHSGMGAHVHFKVGADPEKSLKISILITFLFLIAEIIGAYISGSLTLLGDAFHMLRDVISLVISLGAIQIAKRIPNKEKTFGYHRAEIFAAFLNGVFLIAISIWMAYEAIERLQNGPEIEPLSMLIVGIIGLLANIYAAIKLQGSEDLNIKSAFLHVLADTISSVVVVVGAIVIMTTGIYVIDPLLSLIISFFIFGSTLKIVKQSAMILLEFTPEGIDIDEVVKRLEQIDTVEEVHDVHIWGLSSNINVATLHVLSNEPDIAKQLTVKERIREILADYSVKHTTMQFEYVLCHEASEVEGACIDL